MRRKVKAILCTALLGAACFGTGTLTALHTANAASPSDFTMLEGASLRLVSGSCGLRFRAELTETKYNELIETTDGTSAYKEGCTFGMLIAPASLVSDGAATDWATTLTGNKAVNLTVPVEKIYKDGKKYYFNGVLTNILFNSMNLDFIGIGYSYDGSSYDYADFTMENNARNVAYVAGSALIDSEHDYGEENEAVLLDFLDSYLYRDAGVYAYEKDDSTLYYDTYKAYQEDAERTGGSTDVAETAAKLDYTLSYIDLQKEADIFLDKNETSTKLTVTSKVEGVDFSDRIEWSSENTGVATVDNGTVTKVACGETAITATLFGRECVSTVGVVTKVIDSEKTLKSLISEENVTAYYVLGADIVLTDTFAGITTGTFTGVFDGRGYSISGGKITYGLLGAKAVNATVRNLAMINVGISAYPSNTQQSQGGLLATKMWGKTTIENVYLAMRNPDEWAGAVGVWMQHLMGDYSTRSEFSAKNVVSFVTSDRSNMAAMMLSANNYNKTYSLKNVHVGTSCSTMKAFIYFNQENYSPEDYYTSQAAMQTAYGNGTIDISWAKNFSFYTALQTFLTANA